MDNVSVTEDLTTNVDTKTTVIVAVVNTDPSDRILIICLGVAVVVALVIGILIGYFIRGRIKGSNKCEVKKEPHDADTEEGEYTKDSPSEPDELHFVDTKDRKYLQHRPPPLPPYPHPSIPPGEFSALNDVYRNVPCRESIESGYIDSSEINTKSRIEESNSVIVKDKERIPTYLSLIGQNVSTSESIHIEGLGSHTSNVEKDNHEQTTEAHSETRSKDVSDGSYMSSQDRRVKSQFPENRCLFRWDKAIKSEGDVKKPSVIVEEEEEEI